MQRPSGGGMVLGVLVAGLAVFPVALTWPTPRIVVDPRLAVLDAAAVDPTDPPGAPRISLRGACPDRAREVTSSWTESVGSKRSRHSVVRSETVAPLRRPDGGDLGWWVVVSDQDPPDCGVHPLRGVLARPRRATAHELSAAGHPGVLVLDPRRFRTWGGAVGELALIAWFPWSMAALLGSVPFGDGPWVTGVRRAAATAVVLSLVAFTGLCAFALLSEVFA